MHSAAEWVAAPTPEPARRLEEAGYPETLAALLGRRNVTDEAEAAAFLEPTKDHLHDPNELPGMGAAVERLTRAHKQGEKVALVGDYDVDGLAGTAILAAVFGATGLDCHTILPNRLQEGYGLQPVHVERARRQECRLVVTVDCGATAHEAVTAALAADLDVIVTDHHQPGPPLPDQIVEINPKSQVSTYPFSELSGAGLALKLGMAWVDRIGSEISVEALLRMACLGTICDMVPLVGENRVIASLGLATLPQTPSVGMRALMERAGVRAPLTAADVGFRIGPRLNAAGRLGDATPALHLLLTRDRRQAQRLAGELEERNRQRQVRELVALEGARELFAERHPLPAVLVGWSPDWHKGVVGVAAGRLARELRRPTVLMAVDGDSATGSGRSLPGVDLFRFLEPWRPELDRFGGHSQAVGLTAPTERLESLRESWEEQAAQEWEESFFRRRIEYEMELSPGALTSDLLATLDRLEPFGIGNPQPLIRVGPLRLHGAPRLFGRGHLAVQARGVRGGGVGLLGWGWQERLADLEGEFEVVGYLQADRYRTEPVIRLHDARPMQ